MKWLLSLKLVALGLLIQTAAFAADQTATVLELKNTPSAFHNRTVTLKGRVSDSTAKPRGLTVGEYLLEDNTGKIPVLTGQLPAVNEVIEVTGTFLIDDQRPYYFHLHEISRCCPAYPVRPVATTPTPSAQPSSKPTPAQAPVSLWLGVGLIVLSLSGLGLFFWMRQASLKEAQERQLRQLEEAEKRRRDDFLRQREPGDTGPPTLVSSAGRRERGRSDETMVGLPVAILAVESGPEAGKEFVVMAPRTPIGKESGPSGVLHQTSDGLVSKQHGEILASLDGRCTIVDHKSRNGIRVNGEPVVERLLKAGDMIEIGATQLRFKPKQSASQAAHQDEQGAMHDAPTMIGSVHDQPTVISRMPTLEVTDGPDAGKRLVVLKPVVKIGRHQDNDLVLGDAEMSRHQFELHVRDGQIWLKTVSNSVPTLVDKVAAAETELTGPCDIQVGKTQLRFTPS